MCRQVRTRSGAVCSAPLTAGKTEPNQSLCIYKLHGHPPVQRLGGGRLRSSPVTLMGADWVPGVPSSGALRALSHLSEPRVSSLQRGMPTWST